MANVAVALETCKNVVGSLCIVEASKFKTKTKVVVDDVSKN